MTDPVVRVRIAPSPTGEPHVGTAYIALFNLGFARKHNGQFVLRIEDTDQERSRPEWERQIMHGLAWLGLSWDEGPDKGGPYGPYRQSERQKIHEAHARMLVEQGHAYHCFCTKERLDEVRALNKVNKQNFGYDRHCRDLDPQEISRQLAAQTPFVIRMKMPLIGTTIVQDRLRGAVEFENAGVDDQILLKSDGFPTYHLANVVDDHCMEISHVIRAEEWLSSTPKHVILYSMFGWKLPEFIHMPLLRNADRSKISKRKNPVSILDYRQRGFVPQAVVNYLGQLGWSMPDGRELFSFQDFVDNFSFDRISLGGPVFDLSKLTALNAQYYREQLDDDQLTSLLRAELFSPERLRQIVALVRSRIEKAEDFIPATDYFFRGDIVIPLAELKPPQRTWRELHQALDTFAQGIDTHLDFSPPALESWARELCEKIGWKTKELFMPLRIVFTGRAATPPLFETISLLGRPLVRRRLWTALDLSKKQMLEESKKPK